MISIDHQAALKTVVRDAHEAFRDAVLERPANVVSLDDGISILTVAEAMLTSGRHRSTLQVRYEPSETPSSR